MIYTLFADDTSNTTPLTAIYIGKSGCNKNKCNK